MKVKEYKIFKTAAKTAKENNLILKDKENIFDFSLLNSMEISEHEKEYIKEHDMKYVSAAFRESFYGTEFDNFSACIGKSLYHVQKVFSEATGKFRYRIFTLAKIEHNTQERIHVYDKYTVTTYKESNGYNEPIFDIEMA
jgi:hypothetical protein